MVIPAAAPKVPRAGIHDPPPLSFRKGCGHGVPAFAGTTGGDRRKVHAEVVQTVIPAGGEAPGPEPVTTGLAIVAPAVVMDSGRAAARAPRNDEKMIRITDSIAIDEREIEERFIRASGPGGQNVNKVATAVQLRFDVRHSPSLPDPVRARLERLAGSRLTNDGVLVITAQRHRTQERNRDDALQRLIDLIRQATITPKTRRPTKPTKAARARRLEGKKRRSGVKRLRQTKPQMD